MQIKQHQTTWPVSPIWVLSSSFSSHPCLKCHFPYQPPVLWDTLWSPTPSLCMSHVASKIKTRIPQPIWTCSRKHSWQKGLRNREQDHSLLISQTPDYLFLELPGFLRIPKKGFPYGTAKISLRIELWSWNWLLFQFPKAAKLNFFF